MTQRNPITSLLLALFVPFYLQYWLYVTANEFKSTQKSDAMPKGTTMLLPTFVLFIIWPLSIFSNFALIGNSNSTDSPNILGIILSLTLSLIIFAVMAFHIYFGYRFCKAINQVVNVGLSSGLLTLLFFCIFANCCLLSPRKA